MGLLKAFSADNTSPHEITQSFLKKLAVDPGGQAWDDISVTCHLKRKGVKVVDLFRVGLHGWRLPGSDGAWSSLPQSYRNAIEETGPEALRNGPPAVFHYVAKPREMFVI